MAKILILDDDSKICLFLSQMSESLGYEACTANTLKDGLRLANEGDYDLILLDLEFPEGNGLQILPELLAAASRPEVIIITGTGGVGGAELAFKCGAWDYVQKPFVLHEVSLPMTRALQYRREKEIARKPLTFDRMGIIGSSPALNSCLELAAKASVTDVSVLITGETGTGKELLARAIHENSRRGAGNFITVDCGALPETLVESILFGHERGAFTGADKRREGLIVQADGGTLFFDEIGELPLNTQRTLLRCLQERRILPLGAKQEVAVDFRLVAATNRNLEKLVEAGRFREDLLYRIRAVEIELPPLRTRADDIQEIAIGKIHQLAKRYGTATKGISPEFLELLTAHKWPGNIRELINIIEYALALAGEDPTLHPKHLPPEYRTVKLDGASHGRTSQETHVGDPTCEESDFPTLTEYRDRIEKTYLQMLLEKSRGDRKEACRLSGVSQSRLYDLLKKHQLTGFRLQPILD